MSCVTISVLQQKDEGHVFAVSSVYILVLQQKGEGHVFAVSSVYILVLQQKGEGHVFAVSSVYILVLQQEDEGYIFAVPLCTVLYYSRKMTVMFAVSSVSSHVVQQKGEGHLFAISSVLSVVPKKKGGSPVFCLFGYTYQRLQTKQASCSGQILSWKEGDRLGSFLLHFVVKLGSFHCVGNEALDTDKMFCAVFVSASVCA